MNFLKQNPDGCGCGECVEYEVNYSQTITQCDNFGIVARFCTPGAVGSPPFCGFFHPEGNRDYKVTVVEDLTWEGVLYFGSFDNYNRVHAGDIYEVECPIDDMGACTGIPYPVLRQTVHFAPAGTVLGTLLNWNFAFMDMYACGERECGLIIAPYSGTGKIKLCTL